MAIPLWCSLLLPVGTVNCVQTPKDGSFDVVPVHSPAPTEHAPDDENGGGRDGGGVSGGDGSIGSAGADGTCSVNTTSSNTCTNANASANGTNTSTGSDSTNNVRWIAVNPDQPDPIQHPRFKHAHPIHVTVR
jgi:hypothetical protein